MRNIKVPATTLGLSFSEKFITSFYRVATSIQTVDDPISRRSHYLTDAERLHELWIYASSDVQRWLILVDEVLSGTNSRDRNLAVTSVLKDLHGSSSLCVVTTHELDIAINLAEQYDNFHFSEEITDRGFKFDYSLKPGIVSRSNALRILRHIGFHQELIPRQDQ